mmetsp:Transcript_103375/g.331526  ORF Transcript_103375/g.331526 Transcript_103375/m.331526 type:complete len:220 (+) Transcript_103375:157-816(+)
MPSQLGDIATLVERKSENKLGCEWSTIRSFARRAMTQPRMNFACDEDSTGTASRARSPEARRHAPAQACPAWPVFAEASSEVWPLDICSSVTEPSAADTSKEDPEVEKCAAAAVDAGVRTSPRGNHVEEERAKIVTLSSPGKITAACTSPGARDTATKPVKGFPAVAIGSFGPVLSLHAHLPAVGTAPAHSKTSPVVVTRSKPSVSQEAATIVPWPATP